MAEEKIEAEVVEEEQQPQEFSIIPVQDETTKVFSIQNYDELYARIEKWVQENSPKGKIQNQGDFDYYLKDKPKNKEEALSLRVIAKNLKDLVSSVRKGIINSTMGTFEEQAKNIEKLLDAFDKECKEEKEAWLKATTNKVAKPTALSITIKTYDEKVLEKVKAYALKLGCEVK